MRYGTFRRACTPTKRAIQALAITPPPPRSLELRDHPGRYRLRVETWRIVYRVDDADQVVTILAVRRKTGPETCADLPDVL